MPEVETILNVPGINYICDGCGSGKMLPTGKVFHQDSVTLFPHRCENCETLDNYEINYPVIKDDCF